jgi:ABC-type transport system involved in cytochrome c biogenesis permease subunit
MPEHFIYPVIVTQAFYLYLLANSEKVKRPLFFFVGLVAAFACLAFGFFALGSGISKKGDVSAIRIVYRVLSNIGVLVSFLAAVVACWGGEIPRVAGMGGEEVPSAPAAPPTGGQAT